MRMDSRKNIMGMISILLISLLISFVMLYYFSNQVKDSNERESVTLVLETTEQLNFAFQSRIEDTWMKLDMVQKAVNYVSKINQEGIEEILYEMKESAVTGQIFLLSEEGSYVNSDGEWGNWKTWDMAEEAMQIMQRQERGNLMRHDASGEKCLVFVMPIAAVKTEGTELKYLVAEYKLQKFFDVLQLESFSGKGKSLVIDSGGECIFQTAGSQNWNCTSGLFQVFEGESFSYNEKITDVTALQESIKKGERGAVCVTLDEKNLMLSYVPMQMIDWSLVLLVDHEVICEIKNTEAGRLGELAYMLIFLAVLICFIAYLFMTCQTDKRTNQLLRNRESLMNIISSDTMGVYILASQADRICRYATSDLMPILGVSMDEIIGKNIFEALEKLGLTDLVHKMREWDKKTVLEVKKISYMHPVTKAEIYLRCKCFVPSAGEVAVSIFNETAEVQSELALREAVNAAEAASNSKSNFLSSMSHDMRTPMNAIIGLATLLEKNADDAKRVRNYAKKITASSQHLLGIINDILDMNKIESGKVKLNIEEFNLAVVLENIQTIIAPQAAAKKQSFIIKTGRINEEHLMGDAVRINQILLNLLSNAVKYTSEGGKIVLQVSAVQPKCATSFIDLRFRVTDNGMGMSEEFQKVIFEPFAREENSTIRGIQGTGLGMSITNNLVKMMGGNIFVKSEPGMGTTFTVDLKLRQAEVKQDKDLWKRYNITKMLVAAEEAEQCIDIQSMMSESAVAVDCVTIGNSMKYQLEKLLKGEAAYDLILLDVGTMDKGIAELTAKIRAAAGERTLLILLSRYEWSDEEKEKAVGADGFLLKPFFLSNMEKLIVQLKGKLSQNYTTEEKMPFSGTRFLIAEDNEINAEVLQELLAEEGAKMDVVENGKLALEKFQTSAPGYYDMILMDIQMPVMNGYDASRAIRLCAHPDAKEIPIVAMTANAFMEDVQEALNAGMNAHVAKPVNMDIFKESALELLSGKIKENKKSIDKNEKEE